MNIAPLPNHSATDVPVEQLAHSRTLTEQQKVGEVSRQFEALLLRQILQETQKTVIPSKYSDNSTTASIYHDMVTNQFADSISKSGTVGLAQSIERQLTRQLKPASAAGPDRPAGTKLHLPAATDTSRPILSPEISNRRVASDRRSSGSAARNHVTRHLPPVAVLPFQPTASILPQP